MRGNILPSIYLENPFTDFYLDIRGRESYLPLRGASGHPTPRVTCLRRSGDISYAGRSRNSQSSANWNGELTARARFVAGRSFDCGVLGESKVCHQVKMTFLVYLGRSEIPDSYGPTLALGGHAVSKDVPASTEYPSLQKPSRPHGANSSPISSNSRSTTNSAQILHFVGFLY